MSRPAATPGQHHHLSILSRWLAHVYAALGLFALGLVALAFIFPNAQNDPETAGWAVFFGVVFAALMALPAILTEVALYLYRQRASNGQTARILLMIVGLLFAPWLLALSPVGLLGLCVVPAVWELWKVPDKPAPLTASEEKPETAQ